MDKITFDFENEEFTYTLNGHETTQSMPGLRLREAEILASAGIIELDMTEMRDLLQELMTGGIDVEEFLQKSRDIIEDSIKSEFPEELN